MPNTHITKNYFAHGGDQLVIGGRLTFIPDSTATTVATLREDYNRLLSALRSAGIMAPTIEPSGGGDG